MHKTRTLKRFAIAVAVACLSWMGVMMVAPVASADTLGNGLTVSCNQDSEVHATCVVGGCPRVNGDYVVDAVHAMINGGGQTENDFKCINGQTARYGVDNNGAPVNIGVQGCRKKDLEGDWCTPYANYTFTPPAAAKPVDLPITCPAGSTTPTVPAGQQCTAAPQPVVCPADSPTKTVPAGGTCAVAPAPTDAVTMAAKPAGIGKINVTFTNSANIAGTCDYTATPASNPLGVLPTINKSVAIKAKGTAALNGENAPPPLTSYHLSVTCTGDYNGQNVTFGHAETDVSG
jgi:hypothetical protein